MHADITICLTSLIAYRFIWQGKLRIPAAKIKPNLSVMNNFQPGNHLTSGTLITIYQNTYDELFISIDLSRSTRLIGESSADDIFPPAIIKWTFLVLFLLRVLVKMGSVFSCGCLLNPLACANTELQDNGVEN